MHPPASYTNPYYPQAHLSSPLPPHPHKPEFNGWESKKDMPFYSNGNNNELSKGDTNGKTIAAMYPNTRSNTINKMPLPIVRRMSK